MHRTLSEPPRIEVATGDRAMVAWGLVVCLVLLVALVGPFLAGQITVKDDLGAFHLPARVFYSQALNNGQSFDWWPDIYGGFYLTGEGQVGGYHPLHLLLYRLLPTSVAFAIELWASYPFMLLGMYLFLRRQGLSAAAAIFGGLLFAFSGFNLLHYVHPNAIAVVAHIPWLLWAIDVAVWEPSRSRVSAALVGISFLTASQLLLGYPQYVWLSLLVEAGYLAFALYLRAASEAEHGKSGPFLMMALDAHRDAVSTRPGWKILGAMVVAVVMGVAAAAVQLLPTLDALEQSTRQSADASFALSGSLHPLNVIQLVAPYLFETRVVGQNTHELGLYAGAVPLLLCVWLLGQVGELGPLRPLFFASLGLAAIGLVLAFGEHAFVYQLQTYLPIVGKFRFPCRAIVLVQLALAIAGAIGFSTLADGRGHEGRERPSVLIWLVALLSVAAAVIAPRLWPEHVADLQLVWAGPLVIGLAALLIQLAAWGFRAALFAIVAFAAFDLGLYGLPYSVYSETMTWAQYVTPGSTPPGRSGGRVALDLAQQTDDGPRIGDRITVAGWRRIDGYAGLEPARRLDYRTLAALRVANVPWVFGTEANREIAGLQGMTSDWLFVPDVMPRARFVGQAVTSNDPARDIERIPLASTALTERPLSVSPTHGAILRIVSDQPGEISMLVSTPARQLLVVSESWHPGWEALVDGRPRPIERVNGDFLGCVIEPGRHAVTLRFRPASLRTGSLVSGGSLCLLLICGVFSVAGLARRGRRYERDE